MKHDILRLVSRFDTSRDAWKKNDAFKSRAIELIQVKEELQTLNKGKLSINDNVLKIKFLADKLEGVGCRLIEVKNLLSVFKGIR